jgi:hypothetical protein
MNGKKGRKNTERENWDETGRVKVRVLRSVVLASIMRSGLSQPHFGLSVRVKPTLPKVGIWSPPGLPKIQSSSSRVKTPRIEVFFMSLKSS